MLNAKIKWQKTNTVYCMTDVLKGRGVLFLLELRNYPWCVRACYRNTKTNFRVLCNLLPLSSVTHSHPTFQLPSVCLPHPIYKHCPHGCRYVTTCQLSVARVFLTPNILAKVGESFVKLLNFY